MSVNCSLRKCALRDAVASGLQTTGNVYNCLAHLQGLLEMEEVHETSK